MNLIFKIFPLFSIFTIKITEQIDDNYRKIWTANSINYPYVAALKFKSTNQPQEIIVQRPFCSGSLLNLNWILTAATCATKINSNTEKQMAKILIGSYRNVSLVPLQYYDIQKIIIHPSYNNYTLDNNLALLSTNQSINITFDFDFDYNWNDQMTTEQLYDTILMARWKLKFNYLLNYEQISFDQCEEMYKKFSVNLPKFSLCYQPKEPVIFHQYLVGGPLVSFKGSMKMPIQIGILAFGLNNDTKTLPIVYTSKQPFYDWILSVIN